MTSSTINEGVPLEPLGSRKVRASTGRAGAHDGLKTAMPPA